MTTAIILSGIIRTKKEDGGMALIAENIEEGSGDGCIYARLISWDETKAHPIMATLEGRRVRITIEPL